MAFLLFVFLLFIWIWKGKLERNIHRNLIREIGELQDDLKKLRKSIDMICEQLRAADDEMVHRDEGEGS